jgi:hypothetical protein
MSIGPTLLGQLLQLLPEAVVQTNARRVMAYLNPSWQKLMGHKESVASAAPFLMFCAPTTGYAEIGPAGVSPAFCRHDLPLGMFPAADELGKP